MNLTLRVGVTLAFVSAALAQPGTPGARANTFGSRSGFGSVVFPGVGHAPGVPFSITDPSFASRLGATVSGSPGFSGAPIGRGQHRGPVYIPYAYPVYVGGYGYDQQQQQQQ